MIDEWYISQKYEIDYVKIIFLLIYCPKVHAKYVLLKAGQRSAYRDNLKPNKY